ncbi:hypothetical protein JB92DRAFT_2573786, partial [Gautieria morchelliformis]
LGNGGVLLELDSEEAATWINEAQHRIQFTTALAPEARIKTRLYPLMIQFVPLHFVPDRDNELRHIESTNRLPHGAIDRAKWLKPANHHSPSQTCRHVLITLNSAETANKVLTNGLIMVSAHVTRHMRLTTILTEADSYRAQKNHISYACPQEFNTCGTCGGRHKTSTC